jgi:hypothetical protein
MRWGNARNLVWQTLVVLHRYLGVAVGLLMVVWFVSGIVMMYAGLPRVTDEDRARTLEPISWQVCCRFPPRLAPDNAQLFGAQVENIAGAPVMRVRPVGRAIWNKVQLYGSMRRRRGRLHLMRPRASSAIRPRWSQPQRSKAISGLLAV